MIWGITCFFENRQDFAMIAEIAPKYPVRYIEIRGEQPFFAPEVLQEQDIHFFRSVISRARVRVTLHATFYDINLATINDDLREAMLRNYRRYLALGQAVGAENMVVHAGMLHKDAAPIASLRERARKSLIASLRTLGEEAARRGMRIALENSPPNRNWLLVANWQQHMEILQEVNHPAVGAVLDMAHAHLHGLNLEEYLQHITPYLLEVHAHNNHGQEDEHAGMTRGNIDYATLFRRHPLKVPVIMEIRNFTEAMESLEWIKEFEEA